MSNFWRWVAVFVAVAALDLLFRFGMPFRVTRVLAAEAVIFPAAALAFLYLMRRAPEQVGFSRKLQIVLVAAFFLAGIRSGLWASGVPIGTVNLLVLAVAVVAWTAHRLRRRARARGGAGLSE